MLRVLCSAYHHTERIDQEFGGLSTASIWKIQIDSHLGTSGKNWKVLDALHLEIVAGCNYSHSRTNLLGTGDGGKIDRSPAFLRLLRSVQRPKLDSNRV